VFRKYLDFGTIEAVRKLHAQIRQDVARRDLAGDVKLGPGGIREIEFIAQGFQLIRGGRDPGLRARATLEVLAALGARRQLAEDTVAELAAAYVFLRRLEHRLQYLDDAQTHALPASDEDRRLVAGALGAPDWADFVRELDRHRAAVTRHFDGVFAAPEPNASAPVWQGALEGEAAERDLAARGYVEPRDTLARIRALRTGARYRELPESSRERLDLLVPRFVEACAQAQGAAAPGERVAPDVALRRALDFVESVSRRAAYLALLAEQPQALAKVAGMLAASSWAAEYLTRHPILLDELLDARVLGEAPDWSEFAAALRREMAAHDGDIERQMDAMRELHHAWVFRLLMQDLAGLLTVERLADHLSLAADLVLAVTLEVCWKLVRTRHVEIPRFAVIGYGKLGGKELGYASDLDIVFVYDDPHEAAAENYARLAQRMNGWLSNRTPAGTLFETDLALRPSGGAGLLVSSMSAFKRYQLESAWLWEHQALTRARFCAGDAAIGAVFDALRRDLLQAARDPAQLATEVLTMRQKLLEAHPNRSGLFDLKHDRGGMVDIEFIVQHLVLAHSRAHYELTGNLGNIALLHMAGALGLVPAARARAAADAYRDYRRLQHRLRLNGAEYARVERTAVAAHVEATTALWATVFGAAGGSG
jgi:glutamate-ammonia-ligase adenylyltransferase